MKQTVRADFKTFLKGLITEASPLNFPENAFQEGYNFTLDKSGVISRRFGLDFENGHAFRRFDSLTVDQVKADLPKVYKWEAAGGDVNTDILVVQSKHILYFFNLSSEPFNDGFLDSISFPDFSSYSEFSITDVDGILIVACGADFVIGVEYVKDNLPNPFVPFTIRLETRDVWGVSTDDDVLDSDVSYRPVGITDSHLYNLQNQSWGIPRRNKETSTMFDPISYFQSKLGKFPSNSEQVWPAVQFAPSGDPQEVMYENLWDESLGVITSVSRGYYIIDVVNRGAYRMSAFTQNKDKYPELSYSSVILSQDKTLGGPKVVSSFSGRVWYAGFGGEVLGRMKRSPSLTNHVFFSRLIRNKDDFGKCYQDGDPTSRESTDIVDTDGGFIPISEAKQILGMEAVGGSLVVFATNGIWSITGGSDYGFGATNYKVDKISSFGIIASGSIISEGDKCFYWSKDGIFVIARDQFGSLQVQSISDGTIQEFYINISDSAKKSVRSGYNGVSKQIRWLYQEGEMFNTDSYSYELLLDLNLQAFTVNKIFNHTTSKYRPVAIISSSAFRNTVGEEFIIANGDDVEVLSDDVYAKEFSRTPNTAGSKYLVFADVDGVPYFSFAVYSDVQFKDWGSTDAESLLITGDMTIGDSSIEKTLPYITVHMQPTETSYNDTTDSFSNESSCLVDVHWGWARNEGSNRWSRPQQAYRPTRNKFLTAGDFEDDFRVVSSKLKIRGHGKSMSIRFRSESEKDCVLLGWSTAISGNTSV